MKQQLKHRKEAWRLTLQGQLKLAAAGMFLGAAFIGSAQALPLVGDSIVRAADEQEKVQFALTLPLRNKAELDQLIEHIYTPGDAQFHKFLSSADFDARFAPAQADYDKLKTLAAEFGFTIVGENSSRTLLDVEASTAAIRSVLGSRMQLLRQADGKQFLAPDRVPALPFAFFGLGADAAGLDHRPLHSHLVKKRQATDTEVSAAAQPHAGTQSSGSYGPADIKTAYNLNSIQNGAQAVAIFELSSAKYTDAATYASKFGLTNPTITQKKVDNGTTDTSGSTEVMLDIELVMATANPSSMYVYTGPNSSSGVLDTYSQIANDNLVSAVSTSWGLCESSEGSSAANSEATIFSKMVAEGMTLFAAAGDSGAYDCGTKTLAVDDPASQPNVVGVGGTNLVTTSTQAYTSETPWDTSSTEGGGGGISTLWAIPSYQTGVVSNAPSGQFSTTKRNVPDVALDSDPATGFYIYDTDGCGGWCIVGGTSDAAPQYAAFWSLVAKGLGKSPGFANPTIYQLAENATSYARDFHDVTSGTNNHFSAVVGYDTATGWGSYNGANLYADVIATVGGGSSSSSSSSGGSSSSSSSSGSSSSSSSSSSSGGSSSSSSSSSSGGSSSSSSSSSSGGGSSSSGGTGAPAAPTGLTATGTKYLGQGAVNLNWNASTGATRYYVYMGTTSHGESSTALGYVTSPGAEVTGLTQNKKYYFEVKAYDSAGLSPYSNEASATTK